MIITEMTFFKSLTHVFYFISGLELFLNGSAYKKLVIPWVALVSKISFP